MHLWTLLNGTIVNAATVIIGSLIGIRLGERLGKEYQANILTCLGLLTAMIAIDSSAIRFSSLVAQFSPLVQASSTFGARLAMVVVASLVMGTILGTALRIHERIEDLGGWLRKLFTKTAAIQTGSSRNFVDGFLTTSVIFCIGPLTLLGCLRNGAQGDPGLLYVKAALDGFCSIALASSMGWGVMASVFTILVVQGGLSLSGKWILQPLDELSIGVMTVVGGIILMATAMMILDIRKTPVANFVPGIFFPPFLIALVEWVSPGLLRP